MTIALGLPAHAQDAFVPDHFSTIQSAVDFATDVNGDGITEVHVRPGTYVGNVIIVRSAMRLSGAGAAVTTLQGNGKYAVQVERASAVTLDGFTVSHTGFGAAIELQRTLGVQVRGVVTTSSGGHGIEVNNSTGAELVGNEAVGNGRSGIKIKRSSGCTVSLNASNGNGSHGIDVDRSDANLVEANSVSGNGSDGVRVRQGAGNVVTANTSASNADNGFMVERAEGNVFEGNVGSGNLKTGLRMIETTTNLVTGNTLTGNGEYGIRRRNWDADDFDATLADVQDPAGDNDLTGNALGELRED